MGLSDEVLKALDDLGFVKPSDIQAQAIPRLLSEHRDLIGVAQTGTGKTAAFGLPLIEKVDPSLRYTQALVLAPTRELGRQIAEQLVLFSKYKEDLRLLSVYGGAPIVKQIKALKKPQHIIIATPGRLRDLIRRKSVKLDQLSIMILDEADEMLNMGFKEEIDDILQYTPDITTTWLFSATMPTVIKKIVKTYMDDPIEIKVKSEEKVNKNIEHLYVKLRGKDKQEALMRFLDIESEIRGVVFCRTKRDTQELAEALMKKKYLADALHGDLSQAQRERVMKRFKSGAVQVLIATDVAARGIDVNDLTHVFHYSLPDDNAYYTHRSGRTARAGKSGKSIAFVSGREGGRIKRLENSLKIKFEKLLVPNIKQIIESKTRAWSMRVLDTPIDREINEKVVNEAMVLFGAVSKEELIQKLLSKELADIKSESGEDLNLSDRGQRSDRRDNKGRRGNRFRKGGRSSGKSKRPFFKSKKKSDGFKKKKKKKSKG